MEELDAFHRLVVDPHVRRYLMDGTVFPPAWTAARIRDSDALFARRGVGLWLVGVHASGARIGFCGFLELPDLHPDPQLVYALLEPFTGRGYATEMARAMIDQARQQPGFATIIASVDAPNVASLRVLEKLGFQRCGEMPGAFGATFLLQLAA